VRSRNQASREKISADQLASITAEFDQVGAPFGFGMSAALLPMSAHRAMAECVGAFIDGADALISGIGNDPARLASVLRVPEHEAGLWNALPPADWALSGRPDLLIQGSRVVLIDANFGPLAALFPLNDVLLRAHRGLAARPFFDCPGVPRFVMGTYADLLRRQVVPHAQRVVVTYFAEEDKDGPTSYGWSYRCQADELSRLGLPARVAHAEEIDASSSGTYCAGERVGLVHRFFLPPDPAIPSEVTAFAGLREAAWSGASGVFTGFRGDVFASKAMIAALSDERYAEQMPTALASRLAQAIPWTRVLEERSTLVDGSRIDLVPWTADNRDRLVLKGARGYAGLETVIGCQVSHNVWEDVINRAVGGEPWVVQEFIIPDYRPLLVADPSGDLSQLRLPVVYGAFVLDRHFAGAICRYGIQGAENLNINGHYGAIPVPVYWTAGD